MTRRKSAAECLAARERALATIAGTYTPPPVQPRVSNSPWRKAASPKSERATALRSKTGSPLGFGGPR